MKENVMPGVYRPSGYDDGEKKECKMGYGPS